MYYMPTQQQACINTMNGWLAAKGSCSGALSPGMYSKYAEAQQKSQMASYGSWFYSADSNIWHGVCSSMLGN